MLEGILCGLGVGWLYLVLSGISEPISRPATLLHFAALLIGPALLIIGPALVLTGSRARTGAVLAIIGCAILTGWLGYALMGSFHTRPFQAKALDALDVSLVLLALVSDWAAVRLWQLISNA